MNHIAPMHESAIRDIPLCRLALAPENVRKTPPDEAADAQLRRLHQGEHGLLENLVARRRRSRRGRRRALSPSWPAGAASRR